jgi:hypothetical protein
MGPSFSGPKQRDKIEPVQSAGHCIIPNRANNSGQDAFAKTLSIVHLPIADLRRHGIRRTTNRTASATDPLSPWLAWKGIVPVETGFKARGNEPVTQAPSCC